MQVVASTTSDNTSPVQVEQEVCVDRYNRTYEHTSHVQAKLNFNKNNLWFRYESVVLRILFIDSRSCCL